MNEKAKKEFRIFTPKFYIIFGWIFILIQIFFAMLMVVKSYSFIPSIISTFFWLLPAVVVSYL